MDIRGTLDWICSEISGARAHDAVARIAGHHRIQGSPGLWTAAEDVQAMLAAHGIASKVHPVPADGTTQAFGWTMPHTWEVRSGELRQVTPQARVLVRFDDVPQAVVAHSPGGKVDAPLAHVGEGTTDADYAGREVAGRLVLAHGRARLVARAAAARGAVGIVIYPDSKRASADYDLIQYQGYYARGPEAHDLMPGFSISRRVADELIAALASHPVRLQGEIDAVLGTGTQPVIETHFGDTEAHQVLLCAHLCHPRQSANDNASGSGLLVELARVLHAFQSTHELGHGVRLLWVPEFSGTLSWAVEHSPLLARTGYAVNLDMVGQSPECVGTPLTISQPPATPPSPLNAWLGPLAGLIAARGDVFAPTGSRRPLHWRLGPPMGGSDHLVFNAPPYRVPATMLGHDDPLWHTHLDRLDRVDASRLQQVGVLAGSLALIPSLTGEVGTLADWLLGYAADRLVRASVLGRGRAKTRGRFVQFALGIEQARAEAYAAFAQSALGEAWKPAQHVKALQSIAGALGADARGRSETGGPIRVQDGPIAYARIDDLPEEDRHTVKEKLSAGFNVLLEATANLCDGRRDPVEIAERLSLDLDRWVPEEDVRAALGVLEKLGYVTSP